MFGRGWKHYLFDQMGRTYLDAYNNVPHVGHCHPRIQKIAAKQLQQLNTNTRYLHPKLTEFSNLILDTMPNELNVCYFVNSGSEANELALRLARTATNGTDIIRRTMVIMAIQMQQLKFLHINSINLMVLVVDLGCI